MITHATQNPFRISVPFKQTTKTMENSKERRLQYADENRAEPGDVSGEAELSSNDLEEAAGGRLPCFPDSTSIPPPEDFFEPMGPAS